MKLTKYNLLGCLLLVTLSSCLHTSSVNKARILNLKSSERLQQIIGRKNGRPLFNREIHDSDVKVVGLVRDVDYYLANSPSVSHERNSALFEIVGSQKIPGKKYDYIKFHFGSMCFKQWVKKGQKYNFIFDKEGRFVTITKAVP